MSATTKIAGVAVMMGGTEWIVPPLTLGQVRRLTPDIAAMAISGSELNSDTVVTTVKVVHAALSRNYPELTIEAVEDLLDLSNIKIVANALMGVSGLVPSGEARGEASP